MKLDPNDVFWSLIDSGRLDDGLASELYNAGIIEGGAFSFSEPLFSELNRNNLYSLDFCFLVSKVADLGLFM